MITYHHYFLIDILNLAVIENKIHCTPLLTYFFFNWQIKRFPNFHLTSLRERKKKVQVEMTTYSLDVYISCAD